MEQRHKQRVIGAVVIVALAVIFIPMLLRGPVANRELDVPMEIPPRPEPAVARPAPRPGAEQAPAIDRIPVRTADSSAADGEPSSPPPLREAPEPVAEPDNVPEPPPAVAEEPEPEPEPRPTSPELASFAVQVGSFRSQDNAMGLRNRLRDQGFSAFVEEAMAGGSPIYRLRVGPVVERADAETLASRLRQEADLEALVVSHP